MFSLAVTKRAELTSASATIRPRTLTNLVVTKRKDLDGLTHRLAPAFARTLREQSVQIERNRTRLSEVERRLSAAVEKLHHTAGLKFAALARLLSGLSYESTLGRGYAVVRAGDRVITKRADAEKEPTLEIQFQDGRLETGTRAKKRRPSTDAGSKDDQGSLF